MTDRIEIDWADDGYQHSLADVSDDLREYTVQYGMDTQADLYNFRNVPARGNITLFDQNGKYSTRLQAPLTLEETRTRHLCRITSVYDDGTTLQLWEGFSEPLQAVQTASGNVVRASLVGKLTNVYNEAYSVNMTGRRVNWLIESQTALGPTHLNTHNPTTGLVVWPSPDTDLSYRKNRIGFLNALADYVGAYHWEDAAGYYAFFDFLRMEDEPSLLRVSQDRYRMLAYATRIHRSIEALRNAVFFAGEGFKDDEYTVDDSVATYGRQELQVPPFFSSAQNTGAARTALILRSNPLSHVTLTFPRLQQISEDKRKRIELLRPGVAFDLDIMTDDAEVDGKFFCLGCQLIRQFDSPPLLVVYAVAADLDTPEFLILGSGRLAKSKLGN